MNIGVKSRDLLYPLPPSFIITQPPTQKDPANGQGLFVVDNVAKGDIVVVVQMIIIP